MNEQDELFQRHVRIRPFNAEIDELPLNEAAAADNHGVIAPTHVVLKRDIIVGYLSIAAVPTVLMWLDTQHVYVRDTVDVVNFYENYIAGHGQRGFILPVMESSPLRPFVEKAGYQLVCPATIFSKVFEQPTPKGSN